MAKNGKKSWNATHNSTLNLSREQVLAFNNFRGKATVKEAFDILLSQVSGKKVKVQVSRSISL